MLHLVLKHKEHKFINIIKNWNQHLLIKKQLQVHILLIYLKNIKIFILVFKLDGYDLNIKIYKIKIFTI